MYKAIEYFTDLKDDSFEYKVGDTYPREGYKPAKSRIEELASDKNARKRPVITKVEEEKVEAEEVEEQPKKRSRKKS